MAKLVSQPYETEESAPTPAPAAVTGEEPSTPAVSLFGILIIGFLFAASIYLVFGAFATQRVPV